ncbi:MAG: Wzz/FepE/Etk N-terminal domain-containing protein [Pseudomonadota bacterium]
MDDSKKQSTSVTMPVYYASYPCPENEDDEINLLDLFLVLVKHKVMIIVVVLIEVIGAVIISLLLPDIYRSEATISLRPKEKGTAVTLPGA